MSSLPFPADDMPTSSSRGLLYSSPRLASGLDFHHAEDSNAGDHEHPGLLVDPLDDLPDVGGRTGPNVIPKSTPVGRSYVGKYKFVRDGIDKNAVTGFRSFTTGQPRLCYLRSTLPRAPLPVVSRRSTLADVPELDHKLYAQRVKVNGEDYLPLNTKTVHILQPYLNGAKPVADMSLFERLVVSREYKIRHLNDLLISLASIGKHCKVLVILGEDRIWDLGGIHIRWEPVLKWCTQLQELEVKGE